VAIAADESVSGVPAARNLLDSAAVDVLVVKPSRVGGVRQAHAIARMAADAGTPVTISTLLESGVGIATALHLAATVAADRAHGLGTARTLQSDLLDHELAITDGRMSVPTTPGLGIHLDATALAAYACP
jgi:O-succinylbenzoate synthase